MITKTEALNAAAQFHLLKYYPLDQSGVSDAVLAQLLIHMVPGIRELNWLVNTMLNRVGEWHGPTELRGVLCTRFKPADGIEAECQKSRGFTADEMEMQAITQHESRRLLTEDHSQLNKLLEISRFKL